MKVNGKLILESMSNNKKVFISTLVVIFVFSVVLLPMINKGTYSTEEDIDTLNITCPETASAGSEIECSIVLDSVTMVVQGLTSKYSITDGMEFVEFTPDEIWNDYTNDGDGFVLVNTDGVSGTNPVGTIKYTLPEDAQANEIYKIELVEATIGDGDVSEVVFENVYDEVRILSDINTLDSITLSIGELNETFDKDKNDYTADIDSEKITISVVKTDENSSLTGTLENLELHYGTNNVEIVVTSESAIENVYTLKIYRDYKFSSDVYVYSEGNKYIYTGNVVDQNVILNNIDLPDELSRKIEDNKLIISYESEILKEYNLVSISSSEYDLSKKYIYIGHNDFDRNKISTVNGSVSKVNNKLQVIYDNDVIKEISILSVDFGSMSVSNNSINLSDSLSYNNFVDYITTTEGLTYKLFNQDNEVTGGNIATGMVLRIYYNNVELDSYDVIVYDLEFDSSLTIDEENEYVKDLKEKTSVKDFLIKVKVVGGNAVIYDVNENKKNDDDLIASGDVLTIYSNDKVREQYTLSVLGDANGDGVLDVIDLVQMRKHIVGWVHPTTNIVQEKTGVYYHALDFNKDQSIDLIDLVQMRKTMVGLI